MAACKSVIARKKPRRMRNRHGVPGVSREKSDLGTTLHRSRSRKPPRLSREERCEAHVTNLPHIGEGCMLGGSGIRHTRDGRFAMFSFPARGNSVEPS